MYQFYEYLIRIYLESALALYTEEDIGPQSGMCINITNERLITFIFLDERGQENAIVLEDIVLTYLDNIMSTAFRDSRNIALDWISSTWDIEVDGDTMCEHCIELCGDTGFILIRKTENDLNITSRLSIIS